MPYSHSFGDIRSFKITSVSGMTYVLTAGAEGVIRTWKFEPTKNQFELIATLEGHVRPITCVLLQGK